jgi:hypothetical protein
MKEKYECEFCGMIFDDKDECIKHEIEESSNSELKEADKQKPTHRVRYPVGDCYVDFKECYSEDEANIFAEKMRVTNPKDRVNWILIETFEEAQGYIDDPIRKMEGSPCNNCHAWYTSMDGYTNCTKDCLHLYDFLKKNGINYRYSKPSFYRNREKRY